MEQIKSEIHFQGHDILTEPIAVIGEPLTVLEPYQVMHFELLETLAPLDQDTFSIIVLNVSNNKIADNYARMIRQSEKYSLTPLFSNVTTPTTEALTDGALPDDLTVWFKQFLSRKKQMRLNPDRLDNKLICYLWLHAHRTLLPINDAEQPSRYYYPLISVWDDSELVSSWIYALVSDCVLSPKNLINRTRSCKNCQSTVLNYIDTCPNCQSIDIKTEVSLHCFACGHVEEQSKFMLQSKLSCPNCLTTLRHIGVDYDRPLENYRCNHCKHMFIEAVIKANCFECSESNNLDDTIHKRYYSYQLHDNSKIRAKTGEIRRLPPGFVGEQLGQEHFTWMIDWSNKMAIRHKQQHILLTLRFDNLGDLMLIESEEDIMAQQDAFIERLKALLRQTDMHCKYNPYCFFFLLPNTSEEFIDVIKNKFFELEKIQIKSSLEISIKFFALPSEHLREDTSLWLEQIYRDHFDV